MDSKEDRIVENCAAQLRVLSDSTRISVIRELDRGPLSVSQIGEALGVEQSLLSHHLQVLRRVGLVLTERVGKRILYRPSPDIQNLTEKQVVDLGCCELSFPKK